MEGLVEIRACESSGGGRGVFLLRDVEAGTLLMHEDPFFVLHESVANEETLHFQMALAILKGAITSTEDKETFSELHPKVCPDLHKKRVNASLAQRLASSASVSNEEAIICLLKCQFNAFHSGIVRMIVFFVWFFG